MRKSKISSVDAEAAAPPPLKAHPTRRILLLDDDPFFCHRNADALVRQGYVVNAAENGATGWQELQANYYHLLITENELPKLTGLDLIGKLRSARMAMPVIIAIDKSPKMATARRLGLNPVVTLLKPYTLADFIETVKVVLFRHNNKPITEHYHRPQTPLEADLVL